MAEGVCVECGEFSDNVHQHHTNYEDDETVTLCASCHRMVHSDESHRLYPVDERPDTRDTSIVLYTGTADQLHDMKNRGESYDDVINRLLEGHDE